MKFIIIHNYEIHNNYEIYLDTGSSISLAITCKKVGSEVLVTKKQG